MVCLNSNNIKRFTIPSSSYFWLCELSGPPPTWDDSTCNYYGRVGQRATRISLRRKRKNNLISLLNNFLGSFLLIGWNDDPLKCSGRDLCGTLHRGLRPSNQLDGREQKFKLKSSLLSYRTIQRNPCTDFCLGVFGNWFYPGIEGLVRLDSAQRVGALCYRSDHFAAWQSSQTSRQGKELLVGHWCRPIAPSAVPIWQLGFAWFVKSVGDSYSGLRR